MPVPTNQEERRENYRIVYPAEIAPKLHILGVDYPVVDICEKGVRFVRDAAHRFHSGQSVKGVLTFRGEDRMNLTGVIGRTRGSDVVVLLITKISYQKIVNEQLLLREYQRK